MQTPSTTIAGEFGAPLRQHKHGVHGPVDRYPKRQSHHVEHLDQNPHVEVERHGNPNQSVTRTLEPTLSGCQQTSKAVDSTLLSSFSPKSR